MRIALSLTGRRGGHLDFRQNDTVDFVGDGTIEKPTPENIGVDTKIMFLSCRIAEIDGLPPDSRIFVFVTFSRALAIVRTCIDYHRRRKTEEIQVSVTTSGAHITSITSLNVFTVATRGERRSGVRRAKVPVLKI